MTQYRTKKLARILQRQPGARLVLTAAQHWVVPGGRAAADVAWRLIQARDRRQRPTRQTAHKVASTGQINMRRTDRSGPRP